MEIATLAPLIRVGCRLAPHASGYYFRHDWDSRLQDRFLTGTNAFGAALHAAGWYQRLTSLSQVNVRAFEAAYGSWPQLWTAGNRYFCPECGIQFSNIGRILLHCESTHNLLREDIADILETLYAKE